MEARRGPENASEFKALKRGWCVGGEAFRRELLEQVAAGPVERHYGAAVREAIEAKAERLVREGLNKLGWAEEDLALARKGDERKVRLAVGLRSNTTMPLAWIATRLQMGKRGYLAWLLQQQQKDENQCKGKKHDNIIDPFMTPLYQLEPAFRRAPGRADILNPSKDRKSRSAGSVSRYPSLPPCYAWHPCYQ